MKLRPRLAVGLLSVGVAGVIALSTVPVVWAAQHDDAVAVPAPAATVVEPEKTEAPAPLTAADVQAEYKAAIESFPLSFPSGYGFPTDDGVNPPDATTQFGVGQGRFQAWNAWASATLDAAYQAHLAGDTATATAHLDVLASAAASELDPVLDPEGNFPAAIASARAGDFTEALLYYPLVDGVRR